MIYFICDKYSHCRYSNAISIGDEYRVSMLESLMPPRTYPPARYPPAQKKMLDRPSTMQDVADFVVEYINSDVGRIAHSCTKTAAKSGVCVVAWYHSNKLADYCRLKSRGHI